jgi:aminoglycoside adenylyltransferase-like protein
MPAPHAPLAIGDLPAPVRSAATALRSELTAALGDRLHALYLYGAVTFPESEGGGDLDYHAIMSGPVTARMRAAYQAACDHLAVRPGCDDLDGWVISLDEARGSEPPPHMLQPGLRDKAWALHRAHWLAGRCVVLHGPEPAVIVAAPAWAEQRAALDAELAFLRAAPAEHSAYAVLNACRILHSLADKDVVQSKFGSAAWALEHLPQELSPAIRAALSAYRGTATSADAEALAASRPAIEALAIASLAAS